MLASCLSRARCPEKLRKGTGVLAAWGESLRAALQDLCEKGDIRGAAEVFGEKIRGSYREEMFAFAWERPLRIHDDITAFKRALCALDAEEYLGSHLYCAVPYDGLPGETVLEGHTDLVVRKEGKVIAVNFIPARRKKLKHPEIRACLSKLSLEREYPGLLVHDIYLYRGEEAGRAEDVFHGGKGGQVEAYTFQEYYSGGCFDEISFREGLALSAEEASKPACFFCGSAGRCGKISTVLPETAYGKGQEYRMPEYTGEQMEVIGHTEGPAVVNAGPGSGKTAALVGRIKKLCDGGVPAGFILAVTFTNEAADEIRKRCAGMLKELPTVTTLNALGYRILLENPAAAGKVCLLSPDREKEILNHLVQRMDGPLPGFSRWKGGTPDRYLSEISQAVSAYRQGADKMERKKCSPEFHALYQDYMDIVTKKGYISFDEQIGLCVELLEGHPEIRRAYGAMFRYIMVDEYQDVTEAQCRMTDLLAERHGNIMAIGDCNQSIYGFRGGSSKYILNFKERYPDALEMRLSVNFRSNAGIVGLSERTINGAGREGEGGEDGPLPGCIETPDFPKGAEEGIRQCLNAGCEASDIAVLAWRNDTLAALEKELAGRGMPVRQEKERLIDAPLFRLAMAVLQIYFEKDASAAEEYFSMHGVEKPEDLAAALKGPAARRKPKAGEPESALFVLGECMRYLSLRKERPAASFLIFLSSLCGYYGSACYEMLKERIFQENIGSCRKLLASLKESAARNDGAKVHESYAGFTLLTTVHEAKGREWPCVIIVDDLDRAKNAPGDKASLAYVAITRAKERLIIVTADREKSVFAI